MALLALAFTSPTFSAAAPVTASKKASKGAQKIDRLFNTRYCEILGVEPDPVVGFRVTVFNTVGLNRCPEEQWAALDFPAIADQEGWFAAGRNGPRYWLMDTIYGARPTNPKTFGGIAMRQVATLETTTLSPPPFTKFEIARRTTWVFRKGRVIYTLTDPNGGRYVMQAYTRTEDPTLDPSTLKNLGSNGGAAIPTGWRFGWRKLKRPLVMRAAGKATIVRDGLKGVYQKIQ